MIEKIDQATFLSWAFGDTLDNTLRAVIAEFIVHQAVSGLSSHRANWDAYDVTSQDGTTIEVKSSGLVHSWTSPKPSAPTYDISKKEPWLADENQYLGKTCRYSDVWVFAFHHEDRRDRADPFNVNQWEFLVTTSEWLDQTFGDQKTVRRSVLLASGLKPVEYSGLSQAVAEATVSR